MANSNFPCGIRPINENGTPWSGQGRMVYFPTSQATNIFLGDPLVPLGGTDAFGVPAVGIATAGSAGTVLGGYIGNCNGPAGSGSTMLQSATVYRAASTANYGFICDDPNQLYVIQEDSDGGAVTAAAGGFANADLVSGSGSTVTGLSGWMLDSSSVNTTSTLQLRILGLLRDPLNSIGAYAKWVVRLNLPALWAAGGY